MEINARLRPLVSDLVARCRDTGWLRQDVTDTDISIILRMMATVAGLTEHLADGLWRRYLDLLLDGLSTPRPSPLGMPAPTPDDLAQALTRPG